MAKTRSPKRPRHNPANRRAQGLLAVGVNLPALAAPAMRKRGFAQARLITDWPAIVGDMVAHETTPQKLTFPRGGTSGALLYLRVTSAFAPELQHIAPQVIERINGFFGYRAVASLRYLQGPVPRRHQRRRAPLPRLSKAEETRLQRNLETIKDADLKEALAGLGRAVRAKCEKGRESE
ncbi:MAG: DciA family protein [Pseudomonadota bacterium]|nr:DciA family protein [Pseudomonadota bacterium]